VIILACDPGIEGAVAILDGRRANGTVEIVACCDLPTIGTGKQRRIDAAALAHFIRAHAPYAYAKQVNAFPRQGVNSTFRFGQSYGTIVGVVGAMEKPLRRVTPTKWKKALGLNGEAGVSRARAIETWPAHADLFARKKDHNKAEAALIGLTSFM
jgi:crossover junction endodeoxyribonuclease RuvC